MDELSYAAGVFDVRGSILMHRCYIKKSQYRYPRVRLKVTSSKFKVLDYLKENFGGCITKSDALGYTKEWVLSHEKAAEFLKSIAPYMKNPKKIKLINHILNNWEICQRPDKYKGLTKKEKTARKKFYKKWDSLLHAT